MKKKYVLWLLVQLWWVSPVLAQGDDFMRSMGKMYVVVAVIVAVFIGIVAFLVYLDRKLTKLENQIKNHEPS